MIEPLRAPDDDFVFRIARRRIRRDRRIVCVELDHAFAYLERSLFDVALTAGRLVDASRMSTRSLFRLFRRELDATPHAYVTNQRLATAADLLRVSDLRVEVIAESVGYASHQGFFYAFQRWSHETPRRFRVRHHRLAARAAPTQEVS